MIDTPTKSRLRRFFDRWEEAVDRWAMSPWSSAYVWAFGALWIGTEALRGKMIGWDGFATLAALEIALSIRRHQRRHDPG
jgi:hypothetical protein